MKKLLLIFTLLLWLPAANANEAEFLKGWEAYQAGNYNVAREIWTPLAENGHAASQVNLGAMYENGEGVEQNDNEALKWYRKASTQGFAEDNFDRIKLKLLREAAENGDLLAQFDLAFIYNEGIDISKNNKETFLLYKEAAEHGFALAQVRIGYMYHRGEGVSRDEAKAAEWYSKAAKQGDVHAQHNLGTMYTNSLAVPQSDLLAYMWLSLAVENGNEVSKIALNSLRTSMLSEDRQKAQKMAIRCLKSNYTKCGEKAWWKIW